MKKASAIAIVLIMVMFFALAAVPGCGDKNKDKSILEKVDDFMSDVDSSLQGISEDVDSFAESLQQGTTLTVDMLEETYDTLKGKAQQIERQIQDAKAEIEKVLEKKGVEDYDKYVQLQNRIIENAVEMTETLTSLFGELAAATSALESGSAPSSSELAATAESLSKELDRLMKTGSELKKEAKELKSKLGL